MRRGGAAGHETIRQQHAQSLTTGTSLQVGRGARLGVGLAHARRSTVQR